MPRIPEVQRRHMFAVCLAGLAALPAAPARTQDAPPDQKRIFAAYLNSPLYKSYLDKVFNLTEPPILKAQCASLKLVQWSQHIVVKQPSFVKAGANYNVDTGSWIARAVLDRCGTNVVRRALLQAQPGKNVLQPTTLLPGDFRGNLKLEIDARRIVLPGIAATARCKDLRQVRVLDIKTVKPPTQQGWTESWTSSACDKTVSNVVVYARSGDGVDITAGGWKVK